MTVTDDVQYRPHSDGWSWLSAQSVCDALVFGAVDTTRADQLLALHFESYRSAASRRAARQLHDGVYAVLFEGKWRAVFVFGAKEGLAASSARSRVDDGHMGTALDLFIDRWDDAGTFRGNSRIEVGDTVRPLSDTKFGRAERIIRQPNGFMVTVAIDGKAINYDEADLQVVLGDPRRPEFWLTEAAASATKTSKLLTWLKLSNALTDVLYSFAQTKTTFKPYQFIPALKILSSSSGRLLIADEVGLGKTIEAGLIWTELEQRSPIRRGLIVVPASLQIKWQQEMQRRFMREMTILKVSDLAVFAEQLANDQEPDLVGIISLEALRSASDLLADLSEQSPHFDFIIVDEAHALRNRASKSYSLGNLLSDWSDYLVFLSATPLNLGSEDLFNLVNLLDDGTFPDRAIFEGQLEPNRALNSIAKIVNTAATRSRILARAELERIPTMDHGAALASRPDFARLRKSLDGDSPLNHSEVANIKRMISELNTLSGVLSRTRKVDIPDRKALRQAEQIEVVLSSQERDFYDAIEAHYRNRALGMSVPLGFAMQMPLRQASSSLRVAQARLWDKEPWASEDDDLGYDSYSDSDDSDRSQPTLWNGRPSPDLKIPLTHDTKLEALRVRLRQARQQGMKSALIFSFFKGTVEYLASRLSPEFSTGILHGGVKMSDRESVVDAFRQGQFDILIANQVGSEGLDFQFCNVLVNYDLPWNPMQVEQRIGRLDRFGQQSEKIFIFNMFIPGTIESDIVARLYDRIGVFERSIGDLEPIMRSIMQEINEVLLNPKLTSLELEREIDRAGVAAMAQEDQIRVLEASGGVLTTFSQLEVDGLTEDGPSNGRYVGSHEVEGLLRDLVENFGASLTADTQSDVWQLHGNPRLASALSDLPRELRTTYPGFGKLVAQIRDGDIVRVTYKPESAMSGKTELISTRHPLIQLATTRLAENPESLCRYGAVRIPGLRPGSAYVVRIDIAESRGVRNLTELWVTALDLEDGSRADEVENQLMIALAEGMLEDVAVSPPRPSQRVLALVEGLVAARQALVRTERAQDNSALVDSVIKSETASLKVKLAKAESQLQSQGPDQLSITRMLQGRVRNLNELLVEVPEKYQRQRHLTLSTEFAAIIHITA